MPKCFYQKKLEFLEITKIKIYIYFKFDIYILKIYIYVLTFCIEYLFCLQSNTNATFLQICIDFEEQRLKFSHSESSIIP